MIEITADELPRFMACNGSRDMGNNLPVIDNSSARDEGIAAHYMATTVFKGEYSLDELIDRKAPNGIIMTADMSQHVDNFLTALDEHSYLELDVEQNTSHLSIKGKADFVGIDTNDIVRIIDFRYGWRIVDPEKNWTLISHALGFIKSRSITIDPTVIFDLSIFQPRPYHPLGPLRSWKVTAGFLLTLGEQLTQTLSAPSNTLQTSVHCANCKGLAACPAARKAEMNAIDASDTTFEDTISNEHLSLSLDTLYRASAHLKERLKAFEELATHRIKAGEVVDNYSVEFGLSNAKWKPGIDGSILQALTGKDLTKPELVSPAEAKRRGVNADVVKALTERTPTNIKLVRGNANNKAQQIFGAK